MAKRRTRREKEQAMHPGQPVYSIGKMSGFAKRAVINSKMPTVTAGPSFVLHTDTVLIRKDILKSVFFASLILGLELAIYFYWQ